MVITLVTLPHQCPSLLCIMKNNWEEEVKEYKTQFEGDDEIGEYVDSLIPIYYGDIKAEFDNMNFEIKEYHVGLSMWKAMTESIYLRYMDEFMTAWTQYEEEEE